MRFVYPDSSIIARSYLAHEHGHGAAIDALADPDVVYVTCAIARVEVLGAVTRVLRSRNRDARHAERDVCLDFDIGRFAVISVDFAEVFDVAASIVVGGTLRTLDACHIAAAEQIFRAIVGPDDEAVFLTSDDAQREAAAARGLAVA